ncbi:MAG: prolyl oligopeptidase family serine peptidase [Verrucomicrobia bacterium]|nr:prolyl oligopeptidase family serine peptidase [Verrucomicrobiota bacterium]
MVRARHIFVVLILSWLMMSGDAMLQAQSQRRVAPQPGIKIESEVRSELESGTAALRADIDGLRTQFRQQPRALALLPDIEIFHKAVHWALVHDEFLRSNDVSIARTLLKLGRERAAQLAEGRAPWQTATGLVVRGFVSRIDGSIQPYGLVVPASFASESSRTHRLDVWLHGRDNNLTDLKFLGDRLRSVGDFAPADTFVLHPYGRYCNAFKFAGEVDVFEALEHAATEYPIDRSRSGIRGFSMGGAGTWHLAAHHGGFWSAAAPGAGFAETAEYTKALAKEPKPAWFEQKLWHLYDATDYAANLFNLPTIAYSGELDKQKQAADIMARAMKAEGLELTHLIGPGVEHKYEPKTKLELARQFDALMARGNDPWPDRVRLTTWTLRYNRNKWVTVDAMERHWERARVDAEVVEGGLKVATTNVTELTLSIPPQAARSIKGESALTIQIDQQRLSFPRPDAGNGTASFSKRGSRWKQVRTERDGELRKRHGLQGPIDDAFMDSFLVVQPTGQPMDPAVHQWAMAELAHFTNEWRAQFRGDVRLKFDHAVTEDDIAHHHLILFGDPQSHHVLGRIANQLPVRWDKSRVQIGTVTFPSTQCAPVLIYPNPLNRERYVVINSGFTFWQEGSASNAQQTPKLPDFALVDVTGQGRSSERIRHAGFFGEKWEVLRP